MQRLAQQWQWRAQAAQGADANNAPPRLNKSRRRIRRVLVQRLAQQRQWRAQATQGADAINAPPRLNKSQRRMALQQAQVLKDILYRQACLLEEYQDLSTLEQRVFKAGRAVCGTSQQGWQLDEFENE